LPETHLDLYPHEISGGQQRRVGLARILTLQPTLVILDEPTSASDPMAEHELLKRIGSVFADRSVLLVSHRLSSVRWADRIYVLDAGRIVERGTHDELIARNGLYAELFSAQAAAYGSGTIENR
jgi:ABC-type multidrug transport system fused ATPase/permease subunit